MVTTTCWCKVTPLILSRIDYCYVVFSILPQRSSLSFVFRRSSTLLPVWSCDLKVRPYYNRESAIQDQLQWIRIGERVKFKLWLLVYECLNKYIYICTTLSGRRHQVVLSDDPNWLRLRSSKCPDVFVPGTKTKMGKRAFRVAGPRVWSNLAAPIREVKSLHV